MYIEREAFAASVLVARMEEQALASAPVWDDLCTFDARPWRGLVDLVAGGTPCQDLSHAGKQAGLDGARSRLFFDHVRIANECEAPLFFWENVTGATRIVPRVAEHLHANGYNRVRWCVLRASDVGAPHLRARVFLLAHSDKHGRQGKRGGRLLDRERQACGNDPDGCGGTTADVAAVANPHVPGLQGRGVRGGGCPDERATRTLDSSLGAFPPARSDTTGWARILSVRPELAPAVPRLRGLADGLGAGMDVCVCSRADRLRAAGNGVVAQQAAMAWRVLWDALTKEERCD